MTEGRGKVKSEEVRNKSLGFFFGFFLGTETKLGAQ